MFSTTLSLRGRAHQLAHGWRNRHAPWPNSANHPGACHGRHGTTGQKEEVLYVLPPNNICDSLHGTKCKVQSKMNKMSPFWLKSTVLFASPPPDTHAHTLVYGD